MLLVCQDLKGLDTPKDAASFFCMLFLDVLPFTDDARIVNGKTSKKSVKNRRGGFWCVKASKVLTHLKPLRRFSMLSLMYYRLRHSRRR